MIEVVELSPEREAAYARFVLSDAQSMLYASLEFRDFLRRILPGVPRYLVALKGSEIAGVLPCFSATNSRGRTVINSLPWYGSHGGCIGVGAEPEARRALLARYREMVEAPDVAFATLIASPHEEPHRDEYVSLLRPDATDGRIGQITTLPEDGPDLEGRLEGTLAQKTRNLVRKARKQRFTLDGSDREEAWRFLHETHQENLAQIGGRAKPWTQFMALRDTLPREWRRLSVARLDGRPVAALLLVGFNRTIEYVTPAIQHGFRPLQPLSFLIWNGMLEAVRNGFRFWNWGGTWATQSTLHHFKAGWGARDHPYSYLIHARPDAVKFLRTDRATVAEAFPYYFLYPFALLDD